MDIHRYVAESPTENREYYFASDPGLEAVKKQIEKDVGPIVISDVFPMYSREQVLAVLGKRNTISTLKHILTIIDESGEEADIPEGTPYRFIDHGFILFIEGGDNEEKCQVFSQEYEMV